jgi:mannose-6-phosphate isomerase-like protein (cupin superfamily)
MIDALAVRRLVTIDDERGRSRAIADGPAPDVRADPFQPGAMCSLIWATDRCPAPISSRPAPVGEDLAPPPAGSVCRIVTVPPDAGREPEMRQTHTLDFVLVLEGSITLVLETGEVNLDAGDTLVQRATRHAMSNRSGRPCVLAISSHDARA